MFFVVNMDKLLKEYSTFRGFFFIPGANFNNIASGILLTIY